MENLNDLLFAIKNGFNVYYQSLLYKVKIDFDGDLIVSNGNSGQLVDNSFDFKLFFIS